MIRVLVNLVYLRPGAVGGSEIYCRELLTALAGRDDLRLEVACLAGAADSLRPLGLPLHVIPAADYSLKTRLLAENRDVARLARGADVVFSPANFGLMRPIRTPQVVTIHDLQHRHLPEFFSARKRFERDLMFRWTLRTARRVIAISEFTRQDLLSAYGPPEDRVATVLEGVRLGDRPTDAAALDARSRYDLKSRYVLFPATDNRHKNHVTLIRALARLGPEHDLSLVFTGHRTGLYDAVEAEAHALGIAPRVRHLGLVPHADVFNLLAGADALVFPSRFEGFGLPILEAMHCGTPVLAADAASIPEVAGGGALLLPPTDDRAWAAALERLMGEPALAARLRAAGTQNLQRFSWDRCANETAALLRATARPT
ncbi:MAG: glycosyltransferase family 4 protein [Myxococcales bacterium]|nr:glycosyltransferase family 4 protein [Myxococcales bacterium]